MSQVVPVDSNSSKLYLLVANAHLGTGAVILASQVTQCVLNNLVDQVAAGSQVCLLAVLGSLLGSREHCSSLEEVPHSLLHCFFLLL